MEPDQCDHAWDWTATEDIQCGPIGDFVGIDFDIARSPEIRRMTRIRVLSLAVQVSLARPRQLVWILTNL